jgi:urease accessory protein UreE
MMISTRFTQHSLVTEAHKTIRCYQTKPNISVDATMGNGHDTDFLTRHSKTVYAFDIQEAALLSTEQRLQKNNRLDKVTLIHAGHELMNKHLPASVTIDVFMFNLGYLPHSDEAIITKTKSTLKALEIAINYLSHTGIISIMAYPGHAGGRSEMDAIINWLNSQTANYVITHIHSMQETQDSPRLFTLLKL